jgi:hypothetical protein
LACGIVPKFRPFNESPPEKALKLAEALQMSDEEIKFIDTPTDGRVGMEMLRVLAEEED